MKLLGRTKFFMYLQNITFAFIILVVKYCLISYLPKILSVKSKPHFLDRNVVLGNFVSFQPESVVNISLEEHFLKPLLSYKRMYLLSKRRKNPP